MTRMNTSDNPLRLLPRDDLTAFLSALSQRCELWVPQTVGEGTRFLPYREEVLLNLDQTPPTHPAKSILFPNPETLFHYERTDGGTVNVIPTDLPDPPLVLFGARSCDVRAIDALDAVFLKRSTPDTTYRQRRERLLVIGVGCPDPAPTCFCGRMGGGPFDDAGMDIQMIPLPEGYAFRALTERGEALLTPLEKFLTEADPGIAIQVEALLKDAPHDGVPGDFTALAEAVGAGRDDPFWESLAAVCLGCGICTFVCPVCSCFSLVDEGTLKGGRRIRHWDACMFPTFTREASGHNPRGASVDRIKQRFFHKFLYSFENGEPPGCVGCGRCVAQCPACIDIREVIAHFQAGEG